MWVQLCWQKASAVQENLGNPGGREIPSVDRATPAPEVQATLEVLL